MRKKLWGIILMTLLLTLSTSLVSFANDIEGKPNLARWSYTSSTSQNLSISSGTATMTLSVIGYSGVTTKIKVITDLQKYSDGTWKKVKTYMDTVNSWYMAKQHTHSGLPKGYKYRLRCQYYVYNGTNYEYFILYSNEVSY